MSVEMDTTTLWIQRWIINNDIIFSKMDGLDPWHALWWKSLLVDRPRSGLISAAKRPSAQVLASSTGLCSDDGRANETVPANLSKRLLSNDLQLKVQNVSKLFSNDLQLNVQNVSKPLFNDLQVKVSILLSLQLMTFNVDTKISQEYMSGRCRVIKWRKIWTEVSFSHDSRWDVHHKDNMLVYYALLRGWGKFDFIIDFKRANLRFSSGI